MLVIAEACGFGRSGVNFGAKVRRMSTDADDSFIAHRKGMDIFARALLLEEKMFGESDYKKPRKNRYAGFDRRDGARLEKGELSLEDLRNFAMKNGDVKQLSGKQGLFEQILTMVM